MISSLVSEPNYCRTKFVSWQFITNRNESNTEFMNKISLGVSALEISKIVMYEFCMRYGEKAKLWYMDTDSFIACIKTKDIYKDSTKDIETRFDTLNYELNKGINT